MSDLVGRDKSIIPACDVKTLEQLGKIVKATMGIDGVNAYKVGFYLGLGDMDYGLAKVIDTIKTEYPDAVVIYDHQKACTDVPFTGEFFAEKMKSSKVDAAILFPRENDALTQYTWTKALMDSGVTPMIGAELTSRSLQDGTETVYGIGAIQGVTDFVVPGNKPDRVTHYLKEMFKKFGIDASLYAPGFVKQGGSITEAGKAAGDKWHAICGRSSYNPNDRDNLDDVTIEEMAESVRQLVGALE